MVLLYGNKAMDCIMKTGRSINVTFQLCLIDAVGFEDEAR